MSISNITDGIKDTAWHLRERLSHSPKAAALFISGAIVVASLTTVIANPVDKGEEINRSVLCDSVTAAQSAFENKMQITTTIHMEDLNKYFSPHGSQSCLGNVSFLKIDLSDLIPDPMSLLTGALTQLVTAVEKQLTDAVCKAASNTLSNIANKWNTLGSQFNAMNPNNLLSSTISSTVTKVTAVTQQAINAEAQGFQTQVNGQINGAVNPLQQQLNDTIGQIKSTTGATTNTTTTNITNQNNNTNTALIAASQVPGLQKQLNDAQNAYNQCINYNRGDATSCQSAAAAITAAQAALTAAQTAAAPSTTWNTP